MTVPDWMLERLVLKDLSPEETADVMRQLEEEEGGLDRLAALEASTEAILQRYPPRVVGLTVRQQLAETPRAGRAWLVGLVAAPVLAAAVMLAVFLGLGPSDDDYLASKGEPRLLITLQVDGGAQPLASGQQVEAGDVVQVSYAAMGARHGVIVSIDGAGVTTLHFPVDGDTTLDLEGVAHLANGYRLDAAPDHERFFLVTSEEPIIVDDVLQAARDLAGRPEATVEALEVDGQQASFLLRKEAR